MQNYVVEVFDECGNLILYKTKTVDGYCAEIEARKKYPTYKIGDVARENLYTINKGWKNENKS